MTRTTAGYSPSIRPLEVDDLGSLVRHMVEVYPVLRGNPAALELYRWKYFDRTGRETGMPAGFVASDAAGIAGFIGCMPFWLVEDGRRTPAGWIADWHLADRSRGKGIGRALLREAAARIPALGCVGGSGSAEVAFAAEGFASWQVAHSWLRVDHPLRYEWPRRTGWRKPLGVVRGVERGLRRVTRGRVSAPMYAAAIDGSLDGEPWNQPANGAARDSGYLEWLCRAPGARTAVCLVKGKGPPYARVLVSWDHDRLGRRRGRILELSCGHERDVAPALIAACIELEQRHRPAYVEVVAPDRWQSSLRAAGFERRSEVTLWLKAAGPPSEAAEWHVSLMDKDDAFRGTPSVP